MSQHSLLEYVALWYCFVASVICFIFAFGAARTLWPEGIHCSDDTFHYSVADLELSSKINMSVQDAASGWCAIKIPEALCGCVFLLSVISS